jgi:hypothetical protein
LKDAAARSIDNVLEELETSRGGLTSEEARKWFERNRKSHTA